MSNEHPTRASHELGHRYQPRRIRPRVFDVSFDRSKQSVTPLTPQNNVQDIQPAPIQSAQPHPSHTRHQQHQTSPTHAHAQQSAATSTRTPVQTKPALPRQRRSLVLRRQIHDRAAQYTRQSKAQTNRLVMSFVFGGLATSVIMGGVFIFYSRQQQLARSSVLSAQTTSSLSSTSSTGAGPSETPVSQAEINSYVVKADAPARITIAKLGVEARIYPVEATMNGEPLAASNINDVGWLANSETPGQVGAALLNGSKEGPSRNGVLANLSSVAVGDIIQIEMGNGAELKFEVVDSKLFPSAKVDMKSATSSIIAGRPGLNLLTDVGRYNVRTNTFEDRLLVRTVLKQ